MNAPSSLAIHHSIVVATVTKRYDELGRVKVRFPWMGKEDESDWVVVAMPMTGTERGMFFMPEPDDRVLVAYSQSRGQNSYVIGALWDEDAKPPSKDRPKRMIKSASGHTITLDDTKDKEVITIADKSGKNKIVFDTAKKKVSIESEGDITINADGNITIESKKDVTIKGKNVSIQANQKVSAKGQEMALDGTSGVKVNDGALEVV